MQAYTLPKDLHDAPDASSSRLESPASEREEEIHVPVTFHTMDVDDGDDMEEVVLAPPSVTPRTMQELASLRTSQKRPRRADDQPQPSASTSSSFGGGNHRGTKPPPQPARGGATRRTSKRKRPRQRRDSGTEEESDVEGYPPQVVAPIPAVASSGGRTLRPRKSKTQAQLDEEKEKDLAYRRAVA